MKSMKTITLSAIYLLASCMTFLSAQDCEALKNDSEIRQELQDIAKCASDLMGCCSKWGGNNLNAEIHWGAESDGTCLTRISSLTQIAKVTTTVSWTGSLSGTGYWIKGRLIYDTKSGSRKWEKISDSGGFETGCSKGCIN
ncbi:MAG: hypothetical protein IPJ06_17140 [Saprospiraceae bacterium]|nr:hypothetical protein [Saprospiraceae bacterium]